MQVEHAEDPYPHANLAYGNHIPHASWQAGTLSRMQVQHAETAIGPDAKFAFHRD